MTREEIEEAVERCEIGIATGVWDTSNVGEYRSGKANWIADCALITRAYLSERSERQRRIEAAANAIEGKVVALLLGNGVDMRKHRIVIAKELIDIITRHLDGETDA